MAKAIDLTHTIMEEMPVYPGTEEPEMIKTYTIEVNGFRETKISFYSHTGTHMDAPAHMISMGKTLEKFSVDKFIGKAVLLEFKKKEDKKITLEALKPIELKLREADFLIINTGWHEYWGSAEYFKDFPALTEEAAKWLLQFNLKGIGVDTISIDSIEAGDFKIHEILMNRDLVIIENLNNLNSIEDDMFTFIAMPLKYREADGAPVRAVAILEDKI